MIIEGKKMCSYCKRLKPVTEYHKNGGLNDGLSCYCKTCYQWLSKVRREYLREVNKSKGDTVLEQTKRCSKCGQTKPGTEFYRNSCVRDGLSNYCITCNREYNRKYREKHGEEFKKYHKRYRQANYSSTKYDATPRYGKENKQEVL